MLIILFSVIALFILLQSYFVMASNKTEEQKYTVIKQYDGFEIRLYPAAIIATMHSSAKTYKELSGPGFRTLAGYIFGGNENKQNIAMTAPVQMDINDSVSSMSFVMPSQYSQEALPKPNDPNVRIQQTAEEYVAVIQFGGFASDKELKLYSDKLQTLLKQHGITPIGNYRYLGYNPPYQVVNRRNEIVVKVDWKNN